jgi:glycosyltransferase involved in cell wall biosynthesis
MIVTQKSRSSDSSLGEVRMKVSVIIPVYNAERYLAQAIESVLAQSHTDFDMVIIDDGSTDASLDIARSYSKRDIRVRVYTQTNCGAGETRNRALALCSTDWVFLMDADDLMLPNRIERQLVFLSEHPDLVVASCLASYINGVGIEGGRSANSIPTKEAFHSLVAAGEAVGLLNPGVVLYRPAVLEIGGFRGEFFPAEDSDLWNRMAERGHAMLVQDEVLMKYRIHGSSAVTSSFEQARLKYEWSRSCMAARRLNKPELNWEEFKSDWCRAPLWRKLDRWRKTQAKRNYRLAGQHRLDGQLHLAIFSMALAALLQPLYTMIRLKNQLFR